MQLLVEEGQNTATDAAYVRVTPQELAQATATIEARQNAIAQHEAATIPIGEAVHQLNLKATPEEVLAEVQARRSAQRQLQQNGAKRTMRPLTVKIMAAVIVAQLALTGFLGARLVAEKRQNVSLENQLSYNAASLAQAELTLSKTPNLSNATAPASQAIDVQLLNSDKFRTLDIASGQAVQCKYDAIVSLANGATPSHVYVAKKPTGTNWTLAREGDSFFVKCWTTMGYAEKLINGHEGIVYPTQAGAFDGHADMFIRLPVEAFKAGIVQDTIDGVPVAVVLNTPH